MGSASRTRCDLDAWRSRSAPAVFPDLPDQDGSVCHPRLLPISGGVPPGRGRELAVTSATMTDESQGDPPTPIRINQWLAVVTSILTILATGLGIFGFSQASQRDEVASSADALQRDLDAAHRTVGVLRSDNGRLKQDLSAANSDNAKLQSDNQAMQSEMEQLRGAQPAPPAAGGPAPGQPAEGPVRHDGTVTLANGGDAVDLNPPGPTSSGRVRAGTAPTTCSCTATSSDSPGSTPSRPLSPPRTPSAAAAAATPPHPRLTQATCRTSSASDSAVVATRGFS